MLKISRRVSRLGLPLATISFDVQLSETTMFQAVL